MSIHFGFVQRGPAPRAPRSTAPRGSALAVLALLGCAGDVASPTPRADAVELFWALTLDQHAVVISIAAPYDTVRLTATPRDGHGEPLTGLPAVSFASTDPERVQVEKDGLVRAIKPGLGIGIIASLSVQGVTHTDTAFVTVTSTATPPVLETFSIHPVPPDSAIWYANQLSFTDLYGPKPIGVTARDPTGADIPGLPVAFRSADTTIAKVDGSGYLTGIRPGRVAILASTTAYGVRKADTVVYTITNPVAQTVLLLADKSAAVRFSPSEVTIAAGGIVVWWNGTGRDADVVFDDPTNVAEDDLLCFCGSGNIPAFGDTTGTGGVFDGMRARRFPVAGTYRYRSPITGASGAITVAPPPTR